MSYVPCGLELLLFRRRAKGAMWLREEPPWRDAVAPQRLKVATIVDIIEKANPSIYIENTASGRCHICLSTISSKVKEVISIPRTTIHCLKTPQLSAFLKEKPTHVQGSVR